jgi:urate oxidase
MASIAAARYGKDNVRVYKVERDEKTGVQTVTEMTVCVLLEGAIDTSYDLLPILRVPANNPTVTPKLTTA